MRLCQVLGWDSYEFRPITVFGAFLRFSVLYLFYPCKESIFYKYVGDFLQLRKNAY